MKSIGLFLAVSMVMIALPVTLSAAIESSGSSALVNIELKNVTIEQGIASLFEKSGYKYTIEPGITGKIVELKIKGVTFDQALNAFLKAADLTYELKNGVYYIKQNPQPSKSTTTIVAQGSARSVTNSTPAASVPYTQQQPVKQNQNQQVAALPNPVPSQPSQQITVSQQAPVFYGQPNVNPGYYGYWPNYYQAGNIGIIGGYGGIAVLGGVPYVATYGQGPLPPPGYVSADQLRFLRTIKAITPGLYIYGPSYGPGY